MTHDNLGPHTSEGLRRALGVASDGTRVPDGLAETTWLRGRRVRRRRAALVSGAVAAALATTVLGWSLVGGAPTGRDAIPAGTSAPTTEATDAPGEDGVTAPALTEEPPEPPVTEADAVPVEASAETEHVWQVLRSACLENWGYDVSVRGASVSATKQGARFGDYTRDLALCDAELAMRLPPVDVQPDEDGGLPELARVALREVYAGYLATAECVRAQGMPVDEAPPEEEFVRMFAREWMPSWHPWTAAAEAGDYAEVRSACPVGG